MKSCIVVGTYLSPGQTFVNRHIQHLFGGATCVIADRLTEETPEDGRFFEMSPEDRPATDKLIRPFARGLNHLRHGSSRMPYGSARRGALRFLARHKPDMILSEFGPQGVAIAPIANAAGIPVFCYFRGSDASSRIRHPHVQRAYKKMMPRLAGVFSVSQFLLDNLASVGVSHPNSVVIPSGVDVRRFVPGEKLPGSCLAVGRFVEKKTPLMTIRAFAEAAQRNPQAQLTMIGDGELYEPAKALVSELGLQDRVSLPGALPHEEVRAHLERTEVFVQHSVTARNGNTEGLPTSIQEAMAAGCVVVSTRHAGIPEAVREGQTGYLVEEHDEAGYTEAVARAVALPPEQKRQMGEEARRIAIADYDNAELLKKLEAEIRRTLGR
ncbi:glycosyltransferase [Salipiger sp. PrR002]|uniref:glycosyltransferase n=1 Tax=Salipiger sp. PrR002 TaxID=2706489 RepID=UPI0013BCE8A6|nr:glycosyltransferase [Salipiger sp. PrR002]NDV98000.1 glycosyltransferase [Salipiger sp. PrR002]NDW56975.1 glycosyltransferase [Salipiger sp. PrR004]